ncbi:uncharacterized protein LOC128032603 [Gossypium raimondii]|uniref:uncharacterized protein LOC128032603 n=1 Tax=Gossypium raimondii TaxID=29730 RepID=UPI00227BA72F|nr:uncharacterized protein LOC128032603 [Gossypium raimondii]
MIEYHPSKANVMVNALSQRTMTDLRIMFARLSLFEDRCLLAELQVKPTWIDQIQDNQLGDESLIQRFCQVESGSTSDFMLNTDGVLRFQGLVCVLNDSDLRQSILREAHSSHCAMHPSGNNLYRNLRELYWWPRSKRVVTDFVARFLTYQQVKAEHQLPAGLFNMFSFIYGNGNE